MGGAVLSDDQPFSLDLLAGFLALVTLLGLFVISNLTVLFGLSPCLFFLPMVMCQRQSYISILYGYGIQGNVLVNVHRISIYIHIMYREIQVLW